MSSIETIGLGAGSYPSPKITEQCYTFECECSCKANLSIYANSQIEAEEYLRSIRLDPVRARTPDYDLELDYFYIEDITGMKVENV